MAMSTQLADGIEVPGDPGVPGLAFRRFRGPEDFPGMVESNMAARDAYGIEDTVSVAAMASDYAHLTNSDLVDDLLIVELDERIVGYSRVQWDEQTDGSRAYTAICLLRPELRGRGIGRAMLAWGEGRIDALASGHPPDGRSRWYQAFSWDRDERATALLRRSGYVPVRRGYEMVRPDLEHLPDVPMPEGLEVRPVGPDDMRRLWEVTMEVFHDEWGEVDASEAAWRRFRDDPTHDPSLFVVAFDGDEIAGEVLNVIDPSDTERKGRVRGLLDSVGVRAPWRRRGLARAMIARSLHVLRDHGAEDAYLGVDSENPNQAMTLYESCGFRIVSSETVWRKPLDPGERQ
jgi:mycothiol synthase